MPITGHEGTKTPNEIWDNELERQQMENMIELVIAAHFAKSSAALGAITIFYDPGIAGPKAITDWICDHSFGRLVSKKQMKEGFDLGYYSVPDIVTNRGTFARSEFYEIKPDSGNGRLKGRDSVRRFQRLNQDFRLLFVAGRDYDPKGAQIFRSLVSGTSVYELTLKWWREAEGLILYEISYRFRSHYVPLPLIVVVALLAMLLAYMLGGLRAPRTRPGYGPLPLPVA